MMAAPPPPPFACQLRDFRQRFGFKQLWLSEPDAGFGVGVHRHVEQPRALSAGHRMFTFIGYEALHQGAHTT